MADFWQICPIHVKLGLSQFTIEIRYELLKFIEEKLKQHKINYSC